MSPQLVWYASYGSNLSLERFLKYVEGGKLVGTNRRYLGCCDKTRPRKDRLVTIRHKLFFGCRSGLWNAAMAFVQEAESACHTYGRMYLITDEQFDQVVRQERGLSPEGPRLCPDLSYMAKHKNCYLNREDPTKPLATDKPCSYGLILNLGEEDGYPILTFTAVGPDNEITPRAPSRAYVEFIARGIRETSPEVATVEIVRYFLSCDGVRDFISQEEIKEWLSAV